MKSIRTRVVTVSILFLYTLSAQAELKLPHIISDNMVLQRDQPVSIWGWAEAGAEVTVAFAGQKKTTTTRFACSSRNAIHRASRHSTR